jgi:hypothetical protein
MSVYGYIRVSSREQEGKIRKRHLTKMGHFDIMILLLTICRRLQRIDVRCTYLQKNIITAE